MASNKVKMGVDVQVRYHPRGPGFASFKLLEVNGPDCVVCEEEILVRINSIVAIQAVPFKVYLGRSAWRILLQGGHTIREAYADSQAIEDVLSQSPSETEPTR